MHTPRRARRVPNLTTTTDDVLLYAFLSGYVSGVLSSHVGHGVDEGIAVAIATANADAVADDPIARTATLDALRHPGGNVTRISMAHHNPKVDR